MLGVKALLIGEKMTDLNQSLIPLCEATWELDRTEGHAINEIKETHTSPISEPPIEVPEDLKKNLAIIKQINETICGFIMIFLMV